MLLDVIWPIDGIIEANGIGYVLQKQDTKTEIHLFSSRTNKHFKDRMKLAMTSKGVVGSHDTKKFIGELKYESINQRKLTPQVTVEALNNFGIIISSFLKEKAKLTYLCRGHTFKVGIDKIIAFNPHDLRVHGEDFYHIEFEDENIDTLDGICASDIFRTRLASLLKPLEYEDTKWLRASQLCQERERYIFESPEDLLNYFKRVVNKISPPKKQLEDLI